MLGVAVLGFGFFEYGSPVNATVDRGGNAASTDNP
jgi:hypothetical protein